jgi:enoyl-CoA hydratase
MNARLWRELSTALDEAERDPALQAILITGSGRAFSTGADLKESARRTPEAYRDYLEYLQETSRRVLRCSKPTIAAINGYALGSGYELGWHSSAS